MDTKTGGISRFMSVRKDKKDGNTPHKRQKSRDKSSDRKVSPDTTLIFSGYSWVKCLFILPPSAAFSTPPPLKSPPLLRTERHVAHATIANVLAPVQNRISMPDNVMSLFKADPQKKLDKEQKDKVCIHELLGSVFIANSSR